MKIGICTLALGDEYRAIVKYGIQTKQQYAKLHSYDFITEEGNEDCVDSTRPLAWSKLRLLLKHLHRYDILVWIDADTYIMNPVIQLDHIIQDLMPSSKDIMMVSDWSRANTGVMFCRNTPFTRFFFQTVYQVPNYTDFIDYEQGIIIHLWEQNHLVLDEEKKSVGHAQDHILILPVSYQDRFNSYWFNYLPGHFLLHFPGARKDALRLAMNDYCPIRKENESSDTYYARLTWIFTKSREASLRKLSST